MILISSNPWINKVFDQTDNNIPDGLYVAMLELKVIETDQNSCAVEARSDSHHRLSLHVAWPVTGSRA
jgi:hypothetical protein